MSAEAKKAGANKVYGRVVGKNVVGTDAGTLCEWTMDDAKGTKVWTESDGSHFDRMSQAYQSKDDPHNPDKVQVEYAKKKIERRGGKTEEVNWVTSVSS